MGVERSPAASLALSYEAGTAPVSSIEDGVDATMHLAVSSELEIATGRYFEGMTESRAGDQAYDAGARQRLWRLSETLVGMRSGWSPTRGTAAGS